MKTRDRIYITYLLASLSSLIVLVTVGGRNNAIATFFVFYFAARIFDWVINLFDNGR